MWQGALTIIRTAWVSWIRELKRSEMFGTPLMLLNGCSAQALTNVTKAIPPELMIDYLFFFREPIYNYDVQPLVDPRAISLWYELTLARCKAWFYC